MRKWIFLILCMPFWLEANQNSPVTTLLAVNGVCHSLNSSWTPSWANVIGYWKFDEGAGATSVLDSSPLGTSTGTANGGVTFNTPARVRTAGKFNGSSGYISMGNPSVLRPVFPFTVAAWFKLSAIPTGTLSYAIVGTPDMGTNYSYAGYSVFITAAGAISTQIGNNSGFCGPAYRFSTISANSVISSNRWYHVAAVFTSATNQSIYLNGKAISVTTSGSATSMVYGSGNNFRIGFSPLTGPSCSSPNGYMNGIIDEVAIWNVALSGVSISKLYEQQACGLD